MTAGRAASVLTRSGARLAFGIVALLWMALAVYAVSFPSLTGRIVDQANIQNCYQIGNNFIYFSVAYVLTC